MRLTPTGVDAHWMFRLIYSIPARCRPQHILGVTGPGVPDTPLVTVSDRGVQPVDRQVTWSPLGTPRGMAMRSPPLLGVVLQNASFQKRFLRFPQLSLFC